MGSNRKQGLLLFFPLGSHWQWTPEVLIRTVDETIQTYYKTYTLEELQTKPPHLDKANLEVFLFHSELFTLILVLFI